MAQKNWDVVLRDLHTIKGNARTYGFTQISGHGHEIEEVLFAIERSQITKETVSYVKEQIMSLDAVVKEHQRINDEVLGRTEALVLEKTLRDVGGFITSFKASDFYNLYPDREEFESLSQRVLDLTSDSFRGVLGPLAKSFESLAKQLNKKVPKLVMSGEDFPIKSEISEKYEDIFVHLIRNSMDHGFNHEQQGEIYIDVTSNEYERIIRYSDSGRGLNITKLREVAQNRLGIIDDMDPEMVADLIFQTNVSSAEKVSDISGRGVGMSAVKSFVLDLGGDINVFLGDEKSTGFWAFEIRLRIPNSGGEKNNPWSLLNRLVKPISALLILVENQPIYLIKIFH